MAVAGSRGHLEARRARDVHEAPGRMLDSRPSVRSAALGAGRAEPPRFGLNLYRSCSGVVDGWGRVGPIGRQDFGERVVSGDCVSTCA